MLKQNDTRRSDGDGEIVVIRRRDVLALGGAALLGAAIAGATVGGWRTSVGTANSDTAPEPVPWPTTPTSKPAFRRRLTVDAWRQNRRAPYYIAHRGAADVVPEHTFPSYQRALDWGADCLEISVVMSGDQELYCLHDLTLDRTTTLRGVVAQKAARVIDTARVTVPRLGTGWSRANMPRMPRLTDVLNTIGGHAVLCIEAKDDSAYPSMVDEIEAAGLKDTTMIKVDASSSRLQMAKDAGYPVFAYLGNPEVATASAISALGKRLDAGRDVLVLPARAADGAYLSSDLVRQAVHTGIPVWVFPVHRRSDADHFARLRVQGMITPDLGYLSGSVPPAKIDSWARGRISAGELTKDPYNPAYALQWDEKGAVGLDVPGQPSFLTLGQFCPIEAGSYRIEFDVAFDPLPGDRTAHVSIAFGHRDDRYYEHRAGQGNGYHAVLRGDGRIAIYAHTDGNAIGQLLTLDTAGPPLERGRWEHLTLDVSPTHLRWSRDATSVQTLDSRFRGGYVHVGRSGGDGRLNIRNLIISS
jgi:glycerophosphoryl diester phosphodiesterase